MKVQAILPKNIVQKDNHHFEIIWIDGKISTYRLADIQMRCPCASCVDENTGKRLLKEGAVDPNLRAKRIVNVGFYALKIEFTSGCSTGIYSYDMLYAMK